MTDPASPAGPRHGGLVRRLLASETGLLLDHLMRLDAESRHDRFGMAVGDAFLRQYAERTARLDDLIYGFFVDGELRGAGELRGLGPEGPSHWRAAEAAFSVERPWRRLGVGEQLMARIVRAARNRRAATLYMSCLSRNRAMQTLARKFSAELTFEAGEATTALTVEGPTAFSLIYEAMDDATGFATAMLDLQRRALSRPARL
ncbi:MAG: GNAT family N-acetyltransferase [Rhodoblastus sp.]|nr:MAG: GNAT family N-acetyltransferase [Rhodoblastus sp.]